MESLFGTGHVLVFATAADAEWSNWPGDPSYVVTLQQVVRNVARASAVPRVLAVGQPLRHEVSPSLYRTEARLFAPQQAEAELLQGVASTNTALIAFEYAAVKQSDCWVSSARAKKLTNQGLWILSWPSRSPRQPTWKSRASETQQHQRPIPDPRPQSKAGR